MQRRLFIAQLAALSLTPTLFAQAEKKLEVELDFSEAPHLEEWLTKAKELAIDWYPKLCNLLPVKGYTPTSKIKIELKKSYNGVAYTAGNKITIAPAWLEKQPDDWGMVVHELVHVVQSYPIGRPSWVIEGVADYIRWAIYEGKPQAWFQRPKKPKGYTDSYRITAGFFLWLETEYGPGIVNSLNKAMHAGQYKEQIFEVQCGKKLDDLWNEYADIKPATDEEKKPKEPKPETKS